jgi:fructose transport system ATP-binding protein
MEPILKARGLVKRYGKVTALDIATSICLPGEILAVIGDNGAGKSSLIKVISGAVAQDAGKVMLEGKERSVFSHPSMRVRPASKQFIRR